jgi:hypothetical protein
VTDELQFVRRARWVLGGLIIALAWVGCSMYSAATSIRAAPLKYPPYVAAPLQGSNPPPVIIQAPEQIQDTAAQPPEGEATPPADLAGGSTYEGSDYRTRRPEDGAPRTERVSGYTRRNGTYVAPYSRRTPR